MSTQGIKPYPAYKPSSLSWLSTIPRHWDEKRAKCLFREVDERSVTGKEELLSVSHITGVTLRSQKKVTMFMAESTVGYKLCRPGDLVVNTMWAWMGALGVSPLIGLVSPAYGVYRPFKVMSLLSGFVAYLLRSPYYVSEYVCRSTGIQSSRLRLYPEQLLRIPLVCPPVEEQRLMLRFLAHADRRIRRYIRAKKKLLALLDEQKQAIIHRAVTRGLDDNVPLRSSGVKWLGDVPEHWEVCQVRTFARVGNGSTPSRGNAAYWNHGYYPWLNSSSVNRSPILAASQFVTDHALRECHLPRVQPGSVLVAITGQGKTRGTAAVLAIESTINQHMAYITPCRNKVVPEYLRLAFVAAYRELRSMSDDAGSTKGALTCGDIAHFKVALPPVDEQERVVCSIRQETDRIEVACARAEREIGLVREYRTRLVADVVTGKLDVRDAAAHLPDEPDQPEPLDDADASSEDDDDEEAAADEALADEALEEAEA